MKQFKKILAVLMCIAVMLGVTACGSNADDNGAVQDETINDNNTEEGADNDGALDEIGDDVEKGVDDVTDDIDDAADDLNGDGAKDNMNEVNDATDNK